jgi:ABC-type branched-subunit amino acid transport system substrate-binding protein
MVLRMRWRWEMSAHSHLLPFSPLSSHFILASRRLSTLRRHLVESKRTAAGKSKIALAVLLILLIAAIASYASFTQLFSPKQSASSGNPTFTGSTIKIGYLSEFSGPGEDEGYSARIAAELAVNQTNAAGGIEGKTVSLVELDTNTDPGIASQQAAVLDQQEGVLAITGSTDPNVAIAVSHYAEMHRVPFVASGVALAELSAPGLNFTVSVEPDSVQRGAVVAKYVSEVVPDRKIALMTQNAPEQKEMAAGVRWYADTYRNETIVFDQVFANSQFPWATAATAAKFSGANAVVVSWLPTVGFSESNVVEALLSAGFQQSQIFLTAASALVSDVGTNATGIRGAVIFDQRIASEYPNASAFVSKLYPYITGEANPYIPECAPCLKNVGTEYYSGYLGMKLIIHAIQNVLASGQVLSRASFMASIHQASAPDLLGGILRMDGTGPLQSNYFLIVVGKASADRLSYEMMVINRFESPSGTIKAAQIAKSG